jgi:proteic killer suppression protein
VVVSFADKRLERLCSEEREATRTLGAPGARKLRARLADLAAAARVTDLVAGRPHALKGDRLGQFAVDLDAGRRLTFESSHDTLPRTPDGGIDWRQVTAVRIAYVGNYHA